MIFVFIIFLDLFVLVIVVYFSLCCIVMVIDIIVDDSVFLNVLDILVCFWQLKLGDLIDMNVDISINENQVYMQKWIFLCGMLKNIGEFGQKYIIQQINNFNNKNKLIIKN